VDCDALLGLGRGFGGIVGGRRRAEFGVGLFGSPGQASGAGVQAADGSQLLIKCDKTGKGQVFAVVVATNNLARPLPNNQYESFPVSLRMDDKSPWDDNWRFNDKFAMAVDKGNTRSLTRLLEQLADAKMVEVKLEPIEHAIYNTTFNVAGAREAIAKVYADCKDVNPLK
jgi:phosphoribosylformylglycinamidine (FGAM) synthase-like amidotransferase family enzyme